MKYTDQIDQKITLTNWPPRRIVSLVPSQTEFLADLGLEDTVVGITKFCIHPAKWFQQKQRVGGTKTIDFQKIDALKPDLIIGNKEENEQGQIELLSRKFPVWMSDISTLDHALDMMRSLGAMTGKEERATTLISAIEQNFKDHLSLLPAIANASSVNVLRMNAEAGTTYHSNAAYLIWRKPYMAAASGTFIDDMLHRAGFTNAFADLSRYPEISPEQLVNARPAVIFLSSEPYPFSEKHMSALREICPEASVQLVDGELFSWYGSRLLQAPAYFAALREKLSLK